MKENIKFTFQILIVPVLLALFGFTINNTLQEKQREFDKIKFAEHMLTEAFDADSPDKSFALAMLLPKRIDDTSFLNELTQLIHNRFLKKAVAAAQAGNDTESKRISEA